MESIFITGKNTSTIQGILPKIINDYEVKTCGITQSELTQTLQGYIPDVILICLNGESNGELRLYENFFKQQLAYEDIPLIVAGSSSDIDHLICFIDDYSTTYIYDPQSLDDIHFALNEKMSIIKKKKEEQQAKVEPQIHIQETPSQSITSQIASAQMVTYGPTSAETTTSHETITSQEHQLDDILQNFSFRKNILIIDDDPRMLKALKSQLSNDYQVAVAINGQTALNYLQTHHCDVVLLDYMMPEENGPAVLQKIRNTPHIANLPVIFLTGVNDSTLIKNCLPLKPQGYLLKPVNKEKLQTKLNEIFKMKR